MGAWSLAVGLLLASVGTAGFVARGGVPVLTGRAPAGDVVLVPFLLAVVVGALLVVVGLGIYVGVPGLKASLAREDFDHPKTILACVSAVFILGNLLSVPALVLAGATPALTRATPGASEAPSIEALALAMLGTQFALMVVLIWRIVRPGVITWEDMGLTLDHLDRRLGQGVIGGIGIFVAAGLIGYLLRGVGVEQTQSEMFAAVRGASGAQFMGLWLMAAVVAPTCEESFFRGYVFGALRGRYGRPVAYVGAALLFAVIHLNLPAIVPILVMATGLAFLYDRTRSIVPGIVAHGLNNAVALTLLYAGVAA